MSFDEYLEQLESALYLNNYDLARQIIKDMEVAYPCAKNRHK